MAVVLDSDAIVGFLDADDSLHEAADLAIRDLIRSQRLVVSVVTYAEVLTGARLEHHDEGVVVSFFEELISEVIPVDLAVAEMASRLRVRQRSLRMSDALIVATAEVDPDVHALVTGDAAMGKLADLRCDVRVLR